jgi:integrase/recombinase XerC
MAYASLSQAINAFLMQMAVDGRAALSIESYRRQLLTLARRIGDVAPEHVTPDRFNRFLVSPALLLSPSGTAKRPSSVNRAKSIIRTFFRWCEDTRVIERNPAAHLRLTATSTPIIAHMTRSEVERLLWTIQTAHHPLAVRDHALFATLAYSGIRLSSAIGLHKSDVDLRGHRLILRRTKGGRSEERHLPARLARILTPFLRCRPSAGAGSDTPIFVTNQGTRLSARSVQYRFAFWIRHARIQRPLSVHSLRHTFGTLLYRRTRDLLLVSRALGHRDIRSTQRYAHADDRLLTRAVNGMW